MFRKLKAEEIDIRVGKVINTDNFKGAILLLYKNARVDMAILDETFGVFGWKRSHEVINGNLYCTISIYDNEKKEWISKQDCGVESFSDKEKGESSDSFKRAATCWGIGRELYTAKNIIVPCELDKDGKRPKSGISWNVEKIGYNERGEIDDLVISEKYKNTSKVVYTLNKKPITVEEAMKITIKTSKGNMTLGEMTDDELQYVIDKVTDTEVRKAAELVKLFKAGIKK